MTLEQFSTLVKQARFHREKTSDHLLTFADVEHRLNIDRASDRLVLACIMLRFKRATTEKLN